MVKPTTSGAKVKKGEALSMGITNNDDAKEKYQWEKPEWAKKKVVKPTTEGEKLKKGEALSMGITNNEDAKEKYKWEKPDWTQQAKQVARRHSTHPKKQSSTKKAPVKRTSTSPSDV